MLHRSSELILRNLQTFVLKGKRQTFVLNGLALVRRCTFCDGTTNKDNELLDAWSLKVPEMAYVGGVSKDYGIWPLRIAFHNQKSCDLHLSITLYLPTTTGRFWSVVVKKMNTKRRRKSLSNRIESWLRVPALEVVFLQIGGNKTSRLSNCVDRPWWDLLGNLAINCRQKLCWAHVSIAWNMYCKVTKLIVPNIW